MYNVDSNLIDEPKITELLKLFENGRNPTVLETYNQVRKIYNKDTNYFNKVVSDKVIDFSDNP